ncbi:MAG TPA: FAD-binding oxidoreductase [Pseudonocardiaceae bacterium]|jgi:FAD/FMN-containing dehydrogenase|nr:FAD-binding oxidoreductase [Pseudonocardiaceae bacterium]
MTQTTAVLRNLNGQVIRPGDAGYDESRTVWNAMVDKRPHAIVRCADSADVVAAVRAARELDLPIGVRCGGHGIAGHAVPDDGIMLDLRLMNTVTVDPARRRAWVAGGALLGSLDRATQPYGLATTAGNVSHTGVGGLTLGGGMGWLARQYGLACDNVLSYDVVTADGELVRASEDERPDLYWGLRGGGGNFGVVTRFEFRLHRTGTQALTAAWTYPIDEADRVLRGWRDLAEDAPRGATFDATLSGDELSVGYVWVGDPDDGRRLVPALRSLGRATDEQVRELSYVELQTREDSPQGHSFRRYWKGHYLPELSDGAIEALATAQAGPTGRLVSGVSLQAHGGAIADVPAADTAYSHRDTKFEYVAAVRWSDPADDAERTAAVRRHAMPLDEFASGAYVNVLNDEGQDGLRRAYGQVKLARLAEVKQAYDPRNVFHLNQNVRPVS